MTQNGLNSPYWLILTHDIDLMSLRELPVTGKTFLGFAHRCFIENTLRFIKKRISLSQYLNSMKTFALIPFIKLGLSKDPIAQSMKIMLDIERKYEVRSTLYFMTRTKYEGYAPDGKLAPSNRCAYYELSQYRDFLNQLEKDGWEVGVHGIDSYRSLEDAKKEIQILRDLLPEKKRIGIRMHWLYYKGKETWKILDSAGYYYDSTLGWNDRIGYPEEHYRPFKPTNCSLIVLPLNIQDGALLSYPEPPFDETWSRVDKILKEALQHQAVVTILWHNNSFIVPRYWGELYIKIIERAKSDGAVIMRAIDAVDMEAHSK